MNKDEILTRLFKEGHINLEEFRALDVPVKIEYKYIEKCTCNCNKAQNWNPIWTINPPPYKNPYEHPFTVTCENGDALNIVTGVTNSYPSNTTTSNTNINHPLNQNTTYTNG